MTVRRSNHERTLAEIVEDGWRDPPTPELLEKMDRQAREEQARIDAARRDRRSRPRP